MLNFFKRKKEGGSPQEKLIDLLHKIQKSRSNVFSANDLHGIEAFEELKRLPEEEQKAIILEISNFIWEVSTNNKNSKKNYSSISEEFVYNGKSMAWAIQAGLIRRKLNYTEEEWIKLFKSFKGNGKYQKGVHYNYFRLERFPINYAIKQIEYYLKKNEASEELKEFINELCEWEEFRDPNGRSYFGSDLAKAAQKLSALLEEEGEIPTFNLKTEDIGPAVNQILGTIKSHRGSYDQIFNLALRVSGSKPSKKFSQEVRKQQDEMGLDAYRKIALQLLQTAVDFGPYTQTRTHEYNGTTYEYTDTYYLCGPSQQFIKGIVWTLDRYSDKESIQVLTKLCEKSYSKIPEKGPAAASVGNACVYILGNMRGKDGLGALSRLKLKLRQNNIKKTIDKYLEAGAEKYNVSVEELKEMAVPDFQLEKGEKLVDFADYKLKIFIEGRKVYQQWIKPDGGQMKSVPSTVKKDTGLKKKLAAIRKEVKEIQKVYAAQKQRIDNQFILDRSWDFSSFQKYYLHHGLVYPITRHLIWTFSKGDKTADAILLEDKWYNLEHELIDWLDEECEVKLWHPISASEEKVLGWREKMMELEWKQGIKQAFREIYILTDAEINTRTYSNRMAAHILKQHQFSSLASLRGWKYSLMGAYDDGIYNQICHKYLPEFKITAEYWIDELNQDDAFNDAGIWLYIATDQVKFKNEQGEVMDLVNVPKIVFTEIMRDVDMFVGVCSVGNDPQWMDNNGARQANRDYWTSYSFGDLTEIAKTRKSILERLLPRLKKIRDNARIEGKFLIVKGNLRTYKIHIGSGNILMEPNDQYLCIVPARSAENSTDRIFIPFEGDRGLSIVLSKAFLLAEDDKITDTTITRQINR